MSRHHDKLIADTRAAQAAAGTAPASTEPMTRQAIQSFIAGFALSAASQARIVDRWVASQDQARSAGYDSGRQDSEPY